MASRSRVYSQLEISDRLEIQDLLLRYSHAVDTRDWAAFRSVFTPDAYIDYRVFGGPHGTVDEVVAFLDSSMALFSATQHLISPPLIDFSPDGTTAQTRTMCFNPMILGAQGEKGTFFTCGLWYVDRIVRTADGWRISRRVEEKSYTDRAPF